VRPITIIGAGAIGALGWVAAWYVANRFAAWLTG
jgi:hypothetical protein